MLTKGYWLTCCALLLLALLAPVALHAEDITRLQSGVVKITAKPPQGTPNIGTGFIVRMDKDAAYIVTAAHVVAGDQQPKVEFFTKRNLPITAEVLGLEGDDEVRGLALLVVREIDNLLNGLMALPLGEATRFTHGEEMLVIGFPRNAEPWAIVKGNISSRQGRNILFSPSVDSGHSGGPIIHSGKVVGIVGAGRQISARGVSVGSIQDYIEGFGIAQQRQVASASSVTAFAPPLPKQPAATTKPESQPRTQILVITGKDGAPMVLVPAGQFMMGSEENDKSAEADEKPDHEVYLDAFYIDQYEVSTSLYAKFLKETNPPERKTWWPIDQSRHGRKPVVEVGWNDAVAYCTWAGKRLPTEAEWEKAARGTDQRVFPWGNAEQDTALAPVDKSRGIGGYDQLADVGSFEAGKSPYGVYDMAGNVTEWVADWYDTHYYMKSPRYNPKGPDSGREHAIRGGTWPNEPARARSAERGVGRRGGTVGFRCAQNAPN